MKTTYKIILALAIGYIFGALTYSIKPKDTNEISFVWEGLESDIPADGNQMINLSTNENTIYLNPVDE